MADLKDKTDEKGEKLVISPSYPSETLEDCLIMVREVVKHKGDATPIPKEQVADAMGKAVATIVLRLSCCVQYGIMKNVHGKGYLPTDLYRRIEMPEYDHNRDATMVEAFKNPILYQKLIDRYNTKVLPPESGLENALILEYGINKNSAKTAAKVFFENSRRLRLIDSHNRLKITVDQSITGQASIIVESKQPVKPVEKQDPELFSQPIPLSGNKVAYLQYPKSNMTEKDLAMLELMMPAIMGTIKLNFKEDGNE